MESFGGRVRLIGFAGKSQTGKTTAARALVGALQTRYEESASIISFAEPIKYTLSDLAAQVLGHSASVEEMERLWGKSYRQLKRALGDFGREQLSPSVFIDIARTSVLRNVKYYDTFVFDDVRYQGEAALIQSMNGKIIKIENPRATTPETEHSSEVVNVPFDALVTNDSNMEQYVSDVIAAYTSVTGVSL